MHVAHAICAAEEYLQGFYKHFVAYLPLSSCPGMTISFFVMMLRGRRGGSPGLNVIMMLIFFFYSLEVVPKLLILF